MIFFITMISLVLKFVCHLPIKRSRALWLKLQTHRWGSSNYISSLFIEVGIIFPALTNSCHPDCAETVIKWIVTPIPTCLYLILTRWIYLKDDILIQNDMYVPPGISSTSSATRNYYPLLHNPNDCDLLSEQIEFQIYLLNACTLTTETNFYKYHKCIILILELVKCCRYHYVFGGICCHLPSWNKNRKRKKPIYVLSYKVNGKRPPVPLSNSPHD